MNIVSVDNSDQINEQDRVHKYLAGKVEDPTFISYLVIRRLQGRPIDNSTSCSKNERPRKLDRACIAQCATEETQKIYFLGAGNKINPNKKENGEPYARLSHIANIWNDSKYSEGEDRSDRTLLSQKLSEQEGTANCMGYAFTSLEKIVVHSEEIYKNINPKSEYSLYQYADSPHRHDYVKYDEFIVDAWSGHVTEEEDSTMNEHRSHCHQNGPFTSSLLEIIEKVKLEADKLKRDTSFQEKRAISIKKGMIRYHEEIKNTSTTEHALRTMWEDQNVFSKEFSDKAKVTLKNISTDEISNSLNYVLSQLRLDTIDKEEYSALSRKIKENLNPSKNFNGIFQNLVDWDLPENISS